MHAWAVHPPSINALDDRFYELMDERPEVCTVRWLHPDSLAGCADSLFKFLSGWFDGSPPYVRERDHPRLRMRHALHPIGPVERDEWLLCMCQALAARNSAEAKATWVADPSIDAWLIWNIWQVHVLVSRSTCDPEPC